MQVSKPHAQSTLTQWLDWLVQMHPQEIDMGVARVKQVALALGVVRPAPVVISVAGTNGKGSSVAFLSSILRQAGYQVGAYSSPHLLQFNERIQINGQNVSDADLVMAFAKIEQARQATKLTYFEFATLAALVLFAKNQVQVAVLEVGLGGRLDAVNLVDADAALITAIDIDHIEWLGNDRAQIAREKAGITRTGRLAVCSDPQPPESLAEYCQQHQVPLLQLGQDFEYRQAANTWSLSWGEASAVMPKLPIPALKGEFQLQNAAGVVALLQAMQDQGLLQVPLSAIESGLQQVLHPGRLQSLRFVYQGHHYHWLLDVAHNPQSAQVLSDYLQGENASALRALFSVLSDKDATPMVQVLSPFIVDWHVAELKNPRARALPALQALLSPLVSANRTFYPEMMMAVQAVLEMEKQKTLPQQPTVLVWGSFFTVAEVYQALQRLSVQFAVSDTSAYPAPAQG
ncbi:MAG: bifunctional tetrahydrofolate synthase/dihydrofolate synthase [Thiotrichales bacterium]|nr:bifunctional tetrahydrofolate synthase/dihydrofolate synthase [Thiotrichales bacterium]